MGKVKIKFKIEKMELEIEADRSDVPTIAHGLQKHVAGFVQAPAALITAPPETPPERNITPPAGNGDTKRPRKSNKRDPSAVSTSDAIDFRHDVEKYGSPSQDWTTKEKALWLLYVVAEQTDHKELSYSVITNTFNKHFRQAKTLNFGNVHRDLGKAKLGSLAGEDTSKSPSLWFLTEQGRKTVQALIAGLPKSTAA